MKSAKNNVCLVSLVVSSMLMIDKTHAFLTPFSTTKHRTKMMVDLKSTTSGSTEQTQNLFYAAAGKPTVDMNKYNIPVEQILDEWTALLTPKSTMQEEGIYLNVKNKQELFVDTLQYTVRREGGLGLILTEIAGGREDGVGITIVEEVLQGGNAENTGILPGQYNMKKRTQIFL